MIYSLEQGHYEAAQTTAWKQIEIDNLRESAYRGLFAFREKDTPFFYGREAFTLRLLEIVLQQPMVAVIGSSGSGRSAVVHAGLLAQLRSQDHWRIVSFRPGSCPFHFLAAALIPQLESKWGAAVYRKRWAVYAGFDNNRPSIGNPQQAIRC